MRAYELAECPCEVYPSPSGTGRLRAILVANKRDVDAFLKMEGTCFSEFSATESSALPTSSFLSQAAFNVVFAVQTDEASGDWYKVYASDLVPEERNTMLARWKDTDKIRIRWKSAMHERFPLPRTRESEIYQEDCMSSPRSPLPDEQWPDLELNDSREKDSSRRRRRRRRSSRERAESKSSSRSSRQVQFPDRELDLTGGMGEGVMRVDKLLTLLHRVDMWCIVNRGYLECGNATRNSDDATS